MAFNKKSHLMNSRLNCIYLVCVICYCENFG